MPYKRKSLLTYNERYKRARNYGRAYKGMVNVLTRSSMKKRPASRINKVVISRVNNLYKMIETKELTWKTATNQALNHNQATQLSDSAGNSLNPFRCTAQGAADPMDANQGSRVGDRISVKGVLIKGMFENALDRSNCFVRVMVLKAAKGDAFSTSAIFKGDSGNKMLDQINTERYSIIAQKQFNIKNTPPGAANAVTLAGVASTGATSQQWNGGMGTRTMKMWIPGYKFGNGGNIQYENSNVSQVKFFDYRVVVVVYDWFGTPETSSVVKLNEMYVKTYFKDA